jgi:hypothetical protein
MGWAKRGLLEMRMRPRGRARAAWRQLGSHGQALALALLVLAATGCNRGERSRAKGPELSATAPAAVGYEPYPVGRPAEGRPWIAHVNAVDLDRDGLLDILVSDTAANEVTWIRQVTRGDFREVTIAAEIPAPVRAEVADVDGDGDLDVLVASMGQVFPNNEKIGAVFFLENDGAQQFKKTVLLSDTTRVTDVRPGDFNGDGRLDLALAQFGYDQGEVAWMENRGGGRFQRHILLHRSGAVNVGVADLNGDGSLDVVANLSQEWEEIHLFENNGRGNFTSRVIYGSTNEDFGSSGLSLYDLNGDGRLDLLFTNGDGFDYAEPGARPWHGVQWLENLGQGLFRYHRIGDLPGAFSPHAVDLNGDGALDIVASSGFARWTDPKSVSLMVFLNDGNQRFTPHVLARAPTHLMTLSVGRLDGTDAPPVLVTGGFHAYPPWERMSRVTLWRRVR